MKKNLMKLVVIAILVFCGNRSFSQNANEILKETGIKGGLIVHLGCGDGKLTTALFANDSYLVQGLDYNSANIAKAREYINSKNLYGKVSVREFTGSRLPYAENFVNLLITEDLGKVKMDEVMRVLTPYGVAYVKNKGGAWTKIIKPYPKEMDGWTHWHHGADSNPVVKDFIIGPPKNLQWVESPRWSRSHEMPPSMTGIISDNGRLFYMVDNGPISVGGDFPAQWSLVARNAFNGVILWTKPMPNWGWDIWTPGKPESGRPGNPRYIHRLLIVDKDVLYTRLGYEKEVTAVNAVNGKVLYNFPNTKGSKAIIVTGDIVLINTEIESTNKLFAFTAKTAIKLWEYNMKGSKSSSIKSSKQMFAVGE